MGIPKISSYALEDDDKEVTLRLPQGLFQRILVESKIQKIAFHEMVKNLLWDSLHYQQQLRESVYKQRFHKTFKMEELDNAET